MTTTRGQHLIGKVLGSCVIERLLGYGGTSAVFLAQQHTPEQKVAIKVFLPRSHLNAQMQKDYYSRFLLEAEAASRLDHPNILPIYSYGEQDGLPYIIMPYMPGGTLSEYVASNGCLTLREAQWYLEQIAAALDYAHQHGCVHCDVKPANILLDSDGSVALSDFGIAHMMRRDIISEQSPTKSPETLMGTPDYISPEQALGQPLDGRSDIYSLGVTLFYLLAGSPPFKAESSIAMALLHVHETPPSLGLLRADITLGIDNVIGKALAKWPEERYQTAGEFRDAFAEALVSVDYSATSDHVDNHSGRFRRASIVLKPIAQIKPVLGPSSRFSRATLAIIILLPLLLVSGATVGIVRFLTHTQVHSQPVSPSGTVSPSLQDILAADQGAWQTSSTFIFKDGQYTILNTSAKDIVLAFYGGSHQYRDFRLSVTLSEIHSMQ